MNLYHVTARVSVSDDSFDTVTVWANSEKEAWMKSRVPGRRTRKGQKVFRNWIVYSIEQAK
jgi:hypothetical protein